jgi:hypothetical protein
MGDAEPLPDERVKALLGRVPSKADRERLAKVRDALGIRSTDAVWDIMIALDYHLQLYAAVPDKIAEQSRVAAVEFGRIVEGAKRRERSGRGEIAASIGVPMASPAAAASLGAVAVAFGGICIAAGYLMAGRERPPWGTPGPLGSVLWPFARKSLRSLLGENEVVVIEGAGSPAEINLHASDYVNMRTARKSVEDESSNERPRIPGSAWEMPRVRPVSRSPGLAVSASLR